MASRYCARLNRTVAIGRIARGNRTLFTSPAPSIIDRVDMLAEVVKNDQASRLINTKNGYLSGPTRRMYLNAIVDAPTRTMGFMSDQARPRIEPRYFSLRSRCTRLRRSSR